MNLVLSVNLKKKLEKNDILVFNGKEWINISKSEFLAELNNKFCELQDKLNKLQELADNLDKKVKELRGEDE